MPRQNKMLITSSRTPPPPPGLHPRGLLSDTAPPTHPPTTSEKVSSGRGGGGDIYERGWKLEADCGYRNFFVASAPEEGWAIVRVHKRRLAQNARRKWLVSGLKDHRTIPPQNM